VREVLAIAAVTVFRGAHRAAALEALSLTVKIWTGALMVAGALWVGHIAYETGAPERERLAKVQAEFDVLPREVKERGREFACRRSYKSHDYVQNCIDRGDWGQMYDIRDRLAAAIQELTGHRAARTQGQI
jgi:hypothetical protein